MQCRRRPAPRPGAPDPRYGADQEASLLRGLSGFSDGAGAWMAMLGSFAQGLAGGLALVCLFVTYLLSLRQGTAAFLQYYSIVAQVGGCARME